jgi:ribonuclease HII
MQDPGYMLKSNLRTDRLEAGCDEAGRGCLAGPVFAAAVILPVDFQHPVLNDSKKLGEKARYRLREVIESSALAFSVASAAPSEIDELNILKASILAMHRAIARLKVSPGHLLIDGNRFDPFPGIDHTTVIRGDSIYLSIAAASILAKTYRDDFMHALHLDFPEYGWDRNKGYPTVTHRQAILRLGPTPHHRKSFALLPLQYRLKFD